MKMAIKAGVGALVFLSLSIAATAGEIDGSKPVLCSVATVMECTPVDGCRAVTPESVAVPRFLVVDFEKKVVRPAAAC